MTENLDPLEPMEEPLEEVGEIQESVIGQSEPEDEMPTKRCLFCGEVLPIPAKACHACGHGLGPFETTTPKEYFRWFFCGLLLVIGGFMPCGPDWSTMTLRTMLGGFFFIMGLGVMWNMWGAIYSGRFKMLWVVLLFIPMIWGLWRFVLPMVTGDDMVSLQKIIDNPAMELTSGELQRFEYLKLCEVHGAPTSFPDLFASFGEMPPNWGKVRAWFWVNGYGPAFILAGSLLAWIFLISGMFGAVKHSKAKAAERGGGGRHRRR